jgi:hypothetical protein
MAESATLANKSARIAKVSKEGRRRENGGLILVTLVIVSFLLYWSVWSHNELTKRPKVAKQRGPKARSPIDWQS